MSVRQCRRLALNLDITSLLGRRPITMLSRLQERGEKTQYLMIIYTRTHTAVHHICRRPILALQIAIPSHKPTRTSRQFPLPPVSHTTSCGDLCEYHRTQVADGSASVMAAIFILAVILQVITGMFSHVCISPFLRTFPLSTEWVAQFYNCHKDMEWFMEKKKKKPVIK